MICKNCHITLRTDYSYCPDCGAKVIRNRITFKNLSYDFFERYFNLDNSFLKTFIDLFTKPEKVIGGYIAGIRKKYLNPISYVGIALTLSGITLFLMKNYYSESLDFSGITNDSNPEFAKKWSEFAFDYNSFFFLMYFPILALPAYLLLNKIKYNFSEYLVVFIYVMAHYSVVSFPITVTILAINAESYIAMTQPILAATFVYVLYVLQRINRFNFKALLWRSIVYLCLVLILFFGFMIVLMIILMITGVFSLSDFAPVQ